MSLLISHIYNGNQQNKNTFVFQSYFIMLCIMHYSYFTHYWSILLLSSAFTVIHGQIYTYGTEPTGWAPVKKVCECIGYLVILNTEDKQTRLLDSG